MHLAEIGRRVAPGAHAALVIDGAGYHVAARLAVPRDIRLPPYAPKLNPLENVWEYLRGNKLAMMQLSDDWHDFMKKLDRLRPCLDIASIKRGQQLSFDYDSKNDPGTEL